MPSSACNDVTLEEIWEERPEALPWGLGGEEGKPRSQDLGGGYRNLQGAEPEGHVTMHGISAESAPWHEIETLMKGWTDKKNPDRVLY